MAACCPKTASSTALLGGAELGFVILGGKDVRVKIGNPLFVALRHVPAEQYPAFWEWMGRVDKLKDQLSEC